MKKTRKRNSSKHNKKPVNLNKKELIKNIIWIVIVLFIFYFSIRLIGTENIEEKVREAGVFGPVIFIFLKASTIVFAPLSGMPLYLSAGILFGFFKGILYILIGDFIGFTVAFHISRVFGKKVASYFLSKEGMGAVKSVITHMGTTKGLVQSCLVFIGFPEVVSYGAGLTKISYLKFIPIIMIIGAIPAIILVAAGKVVIESFGAVSLTIVSILLVFIVLVGVFWLHKQAEKNKSIT